MAKYVFGIDVGGTTIKCGLFEAKGTLVEKWEIPTRIENGGENVLPDIAATVDAKRRQKEISPESVLGIGIGIPGPVRDGKVPVAVNLHWGETDVAKTLGKLSGYKVAAGNDANVAALGELWKGGGEGHEDMVMVTLGTGVGGGIIIGGKVVEGAHGAGGEIGHIHASDDIEEPCNCGNRGCLEQVASATGIVRLAREELSRIGDEETELRDDDLSAKSVFDAYKNGDAAAGRIVNRFAAYLGTALGGICTVADPEIIVIGGGVSNAGMPLIDIVGRYFREKAFSACKMTPLVLAKLGNDAGIYGAAKLALDMVGA